MHDPSRTHYDLAVIGGGINGAGIARDAAGRGLKVVLCERDDLAQHTSSASTKLIHGGLRYLEHLEFSLVRKALAEREVLLRAAPHIIWPLRFVMPHDVHLRPVWMIRLGLFFYDHLARREMLPGSSVVNLRQHPAGASLQAEFRDGFEYSDAWVNDARLVVLNCLDAAERGAIIMPRTECIGVEREEEVWNLRMQVKNGDVFDITARAVVNAAGPWVDRFLNERSPVRARHTVRLVKGSHIVVRKLFDHPYAYIFQNPDKRIIFAIPYEGDFTLIGTTDVEEHGDPSNVKISADETAYLCSMVSRYFRKSTSAADVVWSYSGVRPLLEDESSDAASVTRDYTLELDTQGPPLMSVFGGKITTYRRLAEEVLDSLQPMLSNASTGWTAHVPLPGGDIPGSNFDWFQEQLANDYPWLPASLLLRWARAYGSRVPKLLEGVMCVEDLGAEVLPGLYECELHYLIDYEWAQSAEDILWRRSKLGLHLGANAAVQLTAWLTENNL